MAKLWIKRYICKNQKNTIGKHDSGLKDIVYNSNYNNYKADLMGLKNTFHYIEKERKKCPNRVDRIYVAENNYKKTDDGTYVTLESGKTRIIVRGELVETPSKNNYIEGAEFVSANCPVGQQWSEEEVNYVKQI